jgi:ankyrin repeat protein
MLSESGITSQWSFVKTKLQVIEINIVEKRYGNHIKIDIYLYKYRLNKMDIHHYCRISNLIELQALIALGHNINKKHNGWTPLHTASSYGNLEVVKLLISHGADINEKNNCGRTPLHSASCNGHLEIVKELISCGASIEKDNYGETPLHRIMRISNRLEIMKKLIDAGTRVNLFLVNEKNNRGDTPLHVAIFCGKLEMVEEIINYSDLSIKNNDGYTALEIGRNSRSKNIRKFIEDFISNEESFSDLKDPECN